MSKNTARRLDEMDKSLSGLNGTLSKFEDTLKKLDTSLEKIASSLGRKEKPSSKFKSDSFIGSQKGAANTSGDKLITELKNALDKNHKESFKIYQSMESLLKGINDKLGTGKQKEGGGSPKGEEGTSPKGEGGGTNIDVDIGKSGAPGKAAKGGKGVLSKVGGVLGKAALPLAAVMAGVDAYSGYQKAGENLEIEGREATLGEKLSSSAGSVVSGLTFGLLDEKKASKGIAGFFGAGPGKDKKAAEGEAAFATRTAEGETIATKPAETTAASKPVGSAVAAFTGALKPSSAAPAKATAEEEAAFKQYQETLGKPWSPGQTRAGMGPTTSQPSTTSSEASATISKPSATAAASATISTAAASEAPAASKKASPEVEEKLSKFKFNDTAGKDSEEGKIRAKVRQSMRGEDVGPLTPLEQAYADRWNEKNRSGGEAVYNQGSESSGAGPSATEAAPSSSEAPRPGYKQIGSSAKPTATPTTTVTGSTPAESTASGSADGKFVYNDKVDPNSEEGKMRAKIRQHLRGEDVGPLTPEEEKYMKVMEEKQRSRGEAVYNQTSVAPTPQSTATATTVSSLSAENKDLTMEASKPAAPSVVSSNNVQNNNTTSFTPYKTSPRGGLSSLERKQDTVSA